MSNPIVSQIPGFFSPINQVYSNDQDQRLLQHTKVQSDNSRYINLREIALYQTVETITGQQWFNPTNAQVPRYGFRAVYPFTSATLTFNHNLSNFTIFTFIGGGFTDGTNFYPLPYVSTTAANQVGVHVTPTQIVITVGGGAPSVSSGVIVLEYLKQ